MGTMTISSEREYRRLGRRSAMKREKRPHQLRGAGSADENLPRLRRGALWIEE
jgi:hypothetical protein